MYQFLVAISINICRSLKFTQLQWLQFISVWSEEARRGPESERSQKFRTADLFYEYSPIKKNNLFDEYSPIKNNNLFDEYSPVKNNNIDWCFQSNNDPEG